MSPTKIYVMRGTGLGFLCSAILFVFTWSPLAFGLVPLGFAAGYLLSRMGELDWRVMDKLSGSATSRASDRLVSTITSPNLGIRFFSLWLLGLVLLLVAWVIGYYLMPDGFFRQAAVTSLESRGLAIDGESVTVEWFRIFRNNLIPFVLIILANLVIRFNGFPLGYVTPLYNLTLYGLFLGTNSFAIPYPERWAPTFAILQRAGPYEMTAFIMAAAATATWSIYEVRQLFRTNPERVQGSPAISWKQLALLLLAAVLLAGAAYFEAVMITSLS